MATALFLNQSLPAFSENTVHNGYLKYHTAQVHRSFVANLLPVNT